LVKVNNFIVIISYYYYILDNILFKEMKMHDSLKKDDFIKELYNPRSLNDIVSYQDNSIVSKTVIDKKEGTVTLFSFDVGEGLSEHTAPYDAFVYVFDGEAEIIISGKTHNVKSGQVIVMPANEPHALKAKKRFKMLLVMIKA